MSGWFQRLLRPVSADEVETLSDKVVDEGAEPIGSCRRGQVVRVCGTIRSVSLCPQSTSPNLEVELYDGTGHVTLVWMGRRLIPGIHVGRTLVAQGRLTCPDGQPRIYNPEYELKPKVSA